MKLFKKLSLYYFLGTDFLISWLRRVFSSRKNWRVGFIVEEFFHEDLRGFGGFGKTVKNFCDHYNANGHDTRIQVFLAKRVPSLQKAEVRTIHNAAVLLRPPVHSKSGRECQGLINRLNPDLFLTIDYYTSYEEYLLASPATPLIVWLRDPRDKQEWEKLATVPLELKIRCCKSKEQLFDFAREKELSLKRILKLSKILKRKVIFATNAQFLVERAKRTFGLDALEPHFLPNPIPLPAAHNHHQSLRPSLCFVGRIEPVKRPWIVFELAKRFPHIDFYIAGSVVYPEFMQPIVEQYQGLANLKFLGVVDGAAKEKLYAESWGMINTSVHEGLPVTFQEMLSYGKPIISCQNPEGLTEKFGYYTGEILGEGTSEKDLALFSKCIEEFLSDEAQRQDKGRRGKKYVEETHSFASFDRTFKEILAVEKIL